MQVYNMCLVSLTFSFYLCVYVFECVFVYVYVYTGACQYRCLQRLEKDSGSPGAGVAGSYELFNVGTRIKI